MASEGLSVKGGLAGALIGLGVEVALKELMGLEVITNENSQHTLEEWWNKPLDEIENYLKGRPEILHQELINLS